MGLLAVWGSNCDGRVNRLLVKEKRILSILGDWDGIHGEGTWDGFWEWAAWVHTVGCTWRLDGSEYFRKWSTIDC